MNQIDLNKSQKEFRINNYMKLKLERNLTNIYINRNKFRQCIRLVIEIQEEDIEKFDEINSIDEAEEIYNTFLYKNTAIRGKNAEAINDFHYQLSSEEEFWGHCSNIQVWYENNYDTRLLHSNLAFPLLRKLAEVGDISAKEVYKEEIAKRFSCKSFNVKKYLISENYLDCFTSEEIITLLNDIIDFLKDKKDEDKRLEELTIFVILGLKYLNKNDYEILYQKLRSVFYNEREIKYGKNSYSFLQIVLERTLDKYFVCKLLLEHLNKEEIEIIIKGYLNELNFNQREFNYEEFEYFNAVNEMEVDAWYRAQFYEFKNKIVTNLLWEKDSIGSLPDKDIIWKYLGYLDKDEAEKLVKAYLNKLTLRQRPFYLDDLKIFYSIIERHLNTRYLRKFLYVIFKFNDYVKIWEYFLETFRTNPFSLNYKKFFKFLYDLLNDWARIGRICHYLGTYRYTSGNYKDSIKCNKLALKAYKNALKEEHKPNYIPELIKIIQGSLHGWKESRFR